jgi:hypothetical protein
MFITMRVGSVSNTINGGVSQGRIVVSEIDLRSETYFVLFV